jgi:hypothetical protein
MINNDITKFYIFILKNMFEFKYQSWFEYFIKFIWISTEFSSFELIRIDSN